MVVVFCVQVNVVYVGGVRFGEVLCVIERGGVIVKFFGCIVVDVFCNVW